MKERTKYTLCIVGVIAKMLLLYAATVVLICNIGDEKITLLFAIALILSLISGQFYKSFAKYRKGKGSKKKMTVCKLMYEFLPDAILLGYSIYFLYYLISRGVSWLYIFFIFILVWLFKCSVFEIEKYCHKRKDC